MQIAMVCAAICKPMNEPRVSVKVENDWLVGREQAIEIAVWQAVRVFAFWLKLQQINHINKADLDVWNASRSRTLPASASWVGISPQPTSTTSGSSPSSVLAQSQMPRPLLQ